MIPDLPRRPLAGRAVLLLPPWDSVFAELLRHAVRRVGNFGQSGASDAVQTEGARFIAEVAEGGEIPRIAGTEEHFGQDLSQSVLPSVVSIGDLHQTRFLKTGAERCENVIGDVGDPGWNRRLSEVKNLLRHNTRSPFFMRTVVSPVGSDSVSNRKTYCRTI